MATSDRSYSDRHARAVQLNAATSGMTPTFAPADVSLEPVTFGAFLDSIAAANDAVEAAKNDWSSAISTRAADAETAQKLTTQTMAFVISNSAWKLKAPRIKELADKVRGIKARKKVALPPAPEPGQPVPPPVKKRDRGDGSYAEIATAFKAFADAVTKLPAYNPPDGTIAAAALTTLAASLRANNDAVATADSALDGAQRERFAMYCDGDDCLQTKFQAVKNAVKGQYGQNSSQYSEVKGIRA